MAIVVRCECGKKWKFPEESAGKSIACPACQVRLSVPSAEKPAAPAGNKGSSSATVCPNCGGSLPAEAVLCVMCGFDRRTGKRAGETATVASVSKPSGRYPRMGLTLVYWGSRLGFGLITACLGLGLMLVGWFGGGPGTEMKDMVLMIVLGLIYAAIGMQVGAKGSRIDWSREDEDELDYEELLLARGAPALAGIVVGMVWFGGRIDILFGYLLPVGLVGSTFAVVVGLALCFVMSPGAAQKLLATASGLAYIGGVVLLILAALHGFFAALAVFAAAMGEVFLLLWLREMARQLEFEPAVVHIKRLLWLVAGGSIVVAILGLLLSESIEAVLGYPPVVSIGGFSFFICTVLYAAAAVMWRLHIMRALLDEIDVSAEGTAR